MSICIDVEMKEAEKNHEEYTAYLMKHCDQADAELEQAKDELHGAETLATIKDREIAALKGHYCWRLIHT